MLKFLLWRMCFKPYNFQCLVKLRSPWPLEAIGPWPALLSKLSGMHFSRIYRCWTPCNPLHHPSGCQDSQEKHNTEDNPLFYPPAWLHHCFKASLEHAGPHSSSLWPHLVSFKQWLQWVQGWRHPKLNWNPWYTHHMCCLFPVFTSPPGMEAVGQTDWWSAGECPSRHHGCPWICPPGRSRFIPYACPPGGHTPARHPWLASVWTGTS